MYWQYSGNVWWFIAGAIAMIALLIYSWRRGRLPTVSYLNSGAVLVLLWCVMAALELSAAKPGLQVGLANALYVPIPLTCVLWFLFACSFTRRYGLLTQRVITFIVIIPAITMLMASTNPYHNFMFGKGEIVSQSGAPLVLRPYAFWFWIHTAYSYALVVSGSWLIVTHVIKQDAILRRQGFVMIVGATIPFIANLLFLVFRDRFMSIDVTPIAMTVAVLFFAWGIFKYQLFDLVPMARSTVFDCMEELVFVLDTQNRIVDLNPAAAQFISLPKKQVIGEMWFDVPPFKAHFTHQNFVDLKKLSFLLVTAKGIIESRLLCCLDSKKNHSAG